jgi:hypothetical protein
MKEVNMLEPMHVFDERTATNILAEEMRSLYLFSFLLTADTATAERFHGLDAFMGAPHDPQACSTHDQASAGENE